MNVQDPFMKLQMRAHYEAQQLLARRSTNGPLCSCDGCGSLACRVLSRQGQR